jgi:hypothetical protein
MLVSSSATLDGYEAAGRLTKLDRRGRQKVSTGEELEKLCGCMTSVEVVHEESRSCTKTMGREVERS